MPSNYYDASYAGVPYSLDDAFIRFFKGLELTDNQSLLVSTRHNALRERIEQRAPFKIEKTLLYGSYERSSQIRPRPTDEWVLDVDIFVILDASAANIQKYFKNDDGGDAILSDLKKTIDGFQGLVVERDDPSVCVKWTTQKMKAEVTPAFRATNGGFLIPSSSFFTSKWKTTDPFEDSRVLSQSNKITGGELKPFVKAMKCWNRNEGKLLYSYAVETAAYHSVANQFVSMETELKRFFEKILTWNSSSLKPPSEIGDAVPINLGWNEHKVTAALEGVQRAYGFEALGKTREAIQEMATVFGPPFPLAKNLNLFGWGRL